MADIQFPNVTEIRPLAKISAERSELQAPPSREFRPATAEAPADARPAPPPQKSPGAEWNRDELEKMAHDVNQTLSSVTSLNFSVDQEAERLVVKVMDKNEALIRQIPSEEMLDLVKRMKEFEGLLFDVKA
ncbi:MAG: flagellar protein FlaG [Magnetococcales bacterium]|nr:flagellar protein FlaG [Magnetococcales bacterium]